MLCRLVNLVVLIFLIYLSTITESFSLPLSAYEPKDGQRVGFFTGTFNPVHQRHAEIALSLLDQGLLDVLVIVPNDMTYHKTSVIDISHRIQMLEFQFEDAVNIFVPDSADFGGNRFIPIELRTRSYIHSLNPNLEYFGVLGADCVDSKSVNIAVHISKFLSATNDHIKHWYISTALDPKLLASRSQFFGTSGEYVYIPTANEIHSTKIRNYFENPTTKVQMKEQVLYSIKLKVADYISEQGLYYKNVDKPSKAKKMVYNRNSLIFIGGFIVGLHMIDLSQLPSKIYLH